MIIPFHFHKVRAYRNDIEGTEIIGWESSLYSLDELTHGINKRVDDWLRYRYPEYATRVVHVDNNSGLCVIAIYRHQRDKDKDRMPVYNLVCKFQASIIT